ncbi:MAG: YwaF family protein [Firmicutes bacterium]|nr:YwaF family protein [Bacillota bacterium]
MIFIAIGLKTLYKGKSQRSKSILFLVSAIILLSLEAIKQIYGISIGKYELWWLPFHICTIAIIGFAVVGLTKFGHTINKAFWYLSLSTGLLISVGMLLAPQPIIGSSADMLFEGTATYIEIYSIIAHYSFIFLFSLSIALKMYTPQFKDIWFSLLIWIGSLTIIIIAANTMQQNFAMFLSFLNLEKQLGTILFQVILYSCYVVFYLLGAFGLYGIHLIKTKLSIFEIENNAITRQ